MVHELFTGTLTATSTWEEITAGPQTNYSWTINSLYVFNNSGSTAAVQVKKVVSGFDLEVYNDNISDGTAVEITGIVLTAGQSLEIYSDNTVSWAAYGTVSTFQRIPANDVTFNCNDGDYVGVLILDMEISGTNMSETIVLDDEGSELAIALKISGTFNPGVTIDAAGDDPYALILDLEISGEAVVIGPKGNWIGWSKIGEASFRADMVNDAGFMQMPWQGWVYEIKRLGKNVVAYGSGGIGIIYPAKEPIPTYGFQHISQIGIMCKTAVAGDDKIHYFIDVKGRLWNFTSEGLKRLGYEEFLAGMTNPVLSFDSFNRWLYISDAEEGYVFTEVGLGGGWNRLTGLEIVNGDLLGTINDDREMLIPEIQTGPLDFGHRGLKSIDKLLFGMVTDKSALASVDYKYDKDTHFKTSGWTPVNSEGVAHIRVVGVEFKVNFKLTTPGFCELSYIDIQFKKADHRFDRSNRRMFYGDGSVTAYRSR